MWSPATSPRPTGLRDSRRPRRCPAAPRGPSRGWPERSRAGYGAEFLHPGTSTKAGTPVSVEVGSLAPDFTLPDADRAPVSLLEFRGKKAVLLVFYPFAFSGTCTGELTALRDDIDTFQNDQVQVLAVSTDPAPALKAWADQQQFTFPLLSDFWPHGEV